MFNAALLFIIKLLVFPITLASDLIIFPFIYFFQNSNANFTNYMSDVNLQFERFLRGLAFARDVFLNVTHFPRPLFNFFVFFFAFRVSFHAFILFVKWVINMFYLIRGVHAKSSHSS